MAGGKFLLITLLRLLSGETSTYGFLDYRKDDSQAFNYIFWVSKRMSKSFVAEAQEAPYLTKGGGVSKFEGVGGEEAFPT